MIAYAGYTGSQAATALESTTSTGSVTVSGLAGVMYDIALTFDRLTEAINELSWVELFAAYWNYVKWLWKPRRPRAEKLRLFSADHPIIPTGYG